MERQSGVLTKRWANHFFLSSQLTPTYKAFLWNACKTRPIRTSSGWGSGGSQICQARPWTWTWSTECFCSDAWIILRYKRSKFSCGKFVIREFCITSESAPPFSQAWSFWRRQVMWDLIVSRLRHSHKPVRVEYGKQSVTFVAYDYISSPNISWLVVKWTIL